MHPIKEAQQKIEQYQDYIDQQGVAYELLRLQIHDTLYPAIAVMQQSKIILQMLMQNNEHERKNGLTPKVKESKVRLLALLDLNIKLHNITDQQYCLKLQNRELVAKNMMLQLKVAEQAEELKKVAKTFNELQ